MMELAPALEKVPPLSLGTNHHGTERRSWIFAKQSANSCVDFIVENDTGCRAGGAGAAATATTLTSVTMPKVFIICPVDRMARELRKLRSLFAPTSGLPALLLPGCGQRPRNSCPKTGRRVLSRCSSGRFGVQ